MLDYPLHFPGSNATVPWTQTGMSLAVVLVALTVLVLSCCGAAALFLAACCGNRRRDTVAESGDSRWLPGIGLIDYVPVSNRSSVRVSLVLSEGIHDLEVRAEESHTPAAHPSTHRPPPPPEPGHPTATSPLSDLPSENTAPTHSIPVSPANSTSSLTSATSPEFSASKKVGQGGSRASSDSPDVTPTQSPHSLSHTETLPPPPPPPPSSAPLSSSPSSPKALSPTSSLPSQLGSLSSPSQSPRSSLALPSLSPTTVSTTNVTYRQGVSPPGSPSPPKAASPPAKARWSVSPLLGSRRHPSTK